MRTKIMALLLTVFMSVGIMGAVPAMAHQPGIPAQAGRLANCSDKTVNVTKATFKGIALKKVIKIRTLNKNGKHFHITNTYERKIMANGNLTGWVLVARNKPSTCGTAKIVLAPRSGTVNLAGNQWN